MVFALLFRALSVIVVSVAAAPPTAASALAQEPGRPLCRQPAGSCVSTSTRPRARRRRPHGGKGAGHGGGSGGSGSSAVSDGSGGSEGTSFYRSENNFGSSSEVPGVGGPAPARAVVQAGGTSGSGGAAHRQRRSRRRETSVPGSVGLLVLIGAVGVRDRLHGGSRRATPQTRRLNRLRENCCGLATRRWVPRRGECHEQADRPSR